MPSNQKCFGSRRVAPFSRKVRSVAPSCGAGACRQLSPGESTHALHARSSFFKGLLRSGEGWSRDRKHSRVDRLGSKGLRERSRQFRHRAFARWSLSCVHAALSDLTVRNGLRRWCGHDLHRSCCHIPGCAFWADFHRFASKAWFRSDVRNERLPGPCSWVDTIAEVVGHRSAEHVHQR